MRKILCLAMMAHCLISSAAFSQAPLRTINDIPRPVDSVPFDPEELADSIVVFVPDEYMALHVAQDVDRTLKGRVVEVLKGLTPREISLDADRFTTDLQRGVPVKMFLMEHPEKFNTYYPIAIFSITEGAQ